MLLAYAIPLSHSSLHKRWRGSSYAILLWLLYQQRYLDGLISLAFTLPFIMKRCSSLEHTSKLFYFCSCSNQLKEKKKKNLCVQACGCMGSNHGKMFIQGIWCHSMFPFCSTNHRKRSAKMCLSPKTLCFYSYLLRDWVCVFDSN